MTKKLGIKYSRKYFRYDEIFCCSRNRFKYWFEIASDSETTAYIRIVAIMTALNTLVAIHAERASRVSRPSGPLCSMRSREGGVSSRVWKRRDRQIERPFVLPTRANTSDPEKAFSTKHVEDVEQQRRNEEGERERERERERYPHAYTSTCMRSGERGRFIRVWWTNISSWHERNTWRVHGIVHSWHIPN